MGLVSIFFSFPVLVRILKFFHCNFKWFSISNSFYSNFWCFGAEMGWGRVNGLGTISVHTCRPLHILTNSGRAVIDRAYQFGTIKCNLSFWILSNLYHSLEFVSGLLGFSQYSSDMLFFVNVTSLLSALVHGV